MKKILASLALLVGALHILSAVPAYPGWVRMTQPDGSVVTVRLHGDEWIHYMTDERGQVVARAEDGFFGADNLFKFMDRFRVLTFTDDVI